MTEQSTTEAPQGGQIPEGALPGQIVQPNPVELFWEQHKTKIIGAIIVVLAIVGATNFWNYQKRQERNRIWSTFASSVGFDDGYAPADGFNPLKDFRDRLEETPVASFEEAVKKLGGTAAEPLAVWMLANKHASEGNVDGTKQAIESLRKIDDKWPALVKLAFPPVFVEAPEPEDDKDPKAKKPKRPEPDAAIIADLLIARAERVKAFRAKNAALFEIPEPDAKPIVTFETSIGKFTVRVYKERAPKHVAQFLKNVEEKFYDGLRFHSIKRASESSLQLERMYGMAADRSQLAFLGDPESKDEDRTKWGNFESKETIDNEKSGLSHFAFMVGFVRAKEGTGSDQRRIYFTANDCAANRDGSDVLFGRVIDGQDVIRQIAGGKFADKQGEQAGQGVPASPVKVTAVTVEK